APDKDRVFGEAFRVLKNGGRLMISDMVAERLPDQLLEDKAAWCSCISGAMPEREYLEAIRRAGFSKVQVLARADLNPRFLGGSPDLRISSIRVSAVKTI
ncbi:MAG: methyltransferase domain-containing protein, partial [Syntrophothermus sp.]